MKKKKKRRRGGLLGLLLLLLCLAALGWRLRDLRAQVRGARLERDHYQELVAEQAQNNAILSAGIAEGPTQEKMEAIARGELGMVLPDEYVFYNAGR